MTEKIFENLAAFIKEAKEILGEENVKVEVQVK
jgi:hypothetical protein